MPPEEFADSSDKPSKDMPLPPLRASSSRSVDADIARLVQAGLQDLESRRQALQQEVEQLERRRDRIQAEMRTTFAGASQDLAVRLQGFKEYLVGSLQDLATSAEQLDLVPPEPKSSPPETGAYRSAAIPEPPASDMATTAFSIQRFEEQRERVRSLIDQYRTRPDYYGPPWQLRRTFETIHADRVSNWFFTQGGRGAVKSLGSRLQNVLVASGAISALYALYGDRLCTMVLANTPERLGEWRRWLQDCLGVSRADFGSNRGIMLFEVPESMVQRAERLLDNGYLPLLIIDESEDKLPLAALRFPLWLVFAPDPTNPIQDDYY
ncbi:small-conductance mechanosensitive channel [Leptolyngbya sp. Heron Island J]|uniref:DUF3086 domain-containing protein n=1 Tax=Leptolyngbya sp. Heron Island J TaxID=1385935 RepID=UPI0003B9BBF8|nr:DUF3086 domain-containing protein [Leptolyngbya sp. Heron Island J]ESA33751.1 small-conductance mechanosensitive channel [Leptolyngbya sp. Heron Island J]